MSVYRRFGLTTAALVAAWLGLGLGAMRQFPRVPPPDVRPAPAVAAAYQEDAARLAARVLAGTTPPAARSPRLPPALVESLLNALLRVHGFTHPARDAVVDRYRLHTFGNPALYELMVSVHSDEPWAKAWHAGAATTGHARFDALVREYELRVTRRGLVLRSPAPLDIDALAARFAALPGVRYAEANGTVGDGNDIQAAAAGDGWRLDYSLGWGDCPAGCIQRHTWSFRVAASGAVEFLRSVGPPPPPR